MLRVIKAVRDCLEARLTVAEYSKARGLGCTSTMNVRTYPAFQVTASKVDLLDVQLGRERIIGAYSLVIYNSAPTLHRL
jgi:hypothetical protein